MILGIGIDWLDARRVERELLRHDWSLDDGIFTAAEIRHCSAARHPARWFAVCFAAKEAALKALGLPVSDLGFFREVEVRFLHSQQQLILHKRSKARSTRMGVRHIRMALARGHVHVGATVVLES